MKVFDVTTGTMPLNETRSVVAPDIGEAGRLFLDKYWPCKIKAIKLHSECVIVSPDAVQEETND